jgi:hypothetical protein
VPAFESVAGLGDIDPFCLNDLWFLCVRLLGSAYLCNSTAVLPDMFMQPVIRRKFGLAVPAVI